MVFAANRAAVEIWRRCDRRFDGDAGFVLFPAGASSGTALLFRLVWAHAER
jgi:hypothetical protein